MGINLSKLFLNLLGWKIKNNLANEMPLKAVIIAAPHTSWVDFPIGFLAFKAMGMKVHYLIKKEAFIFPFKSLLKSLGGISVDRNVKNTVVEDTVGYFKKNKKFILTITPEGTRAPVKTWKSGYHRIATAANVPVILGFLDFKTKTIGIAHIYNLKGTFEEDTFNIMQFYKDMKGLHPEKFYLPYEILNS